MAAPETHPLEHIVTIRRLLEHYQEGFAFIKELIQNADDALKDSPESGRLHLQWYQPPTTSPFENPLLHGPALVVINDGPFTKGDRDGLMRMGMGSKAGDNERIGRFGLGMKAVFHVSEAFFFLESGGDKHLREMFCPWLPPQYEEWQITDEHQDWDRMSGVVKGIVPDFKKWFAVWIPLRRKELITNKNPIVGGTHAYPGDCDACPENLIRAIEHQKPGLGEALIFLKRLSKVCFHDGNRTFDFEHHHEKNRVSPATQYYRIDTEQSDDFAEVWKAKSAWPKVFEIAETGEQSVPDKAKWDASVAIAASKSFDSTGGALRIFWNVFLPVGNRPQVEENLPTLGYDLHMFLHGYFFLSEDRTSVHGVSDKFQDASEDDPKRIKIAWNKALATSANGLLPMVPKALQKCFAGEKFSDNQIKVVITCLKTSEWFKTYRQEICQTHSLACSLDSGTWKWRLFESKKSRLVFPKFDDPEISDSEGILTRLLGNGNLDRIILIESTAALESADLKMGWTETDLTWLCDSVQSAVLAKSPEVRKYFTKYKTRIKSAADRGSKVSHL